MAVPDGSGGAERHPGNSPERGRGRRKKRSRGSETVKVGDGAAAGCVQIPQALQGARGQHLLSGHLMSLVKGDEKIDTTYVALSIKAQNTHFKQFLAFVSGFRKDETVNKLGDTVAMHELNDKAVSG